MAVITYLTVMNLFLSLVCVLKTIFTELNIFLAFGQICRENPLEGSA